jgi:hypothetical protein
LRHRGNGGPGHLRRDRVPPDDAEERDEPDELTLGRLEPDERTLDDPAEDRDGDRTDDEDLPDDGTLRMEEGERRYGELVPMVRLGRIGEVRGTMTGRDELTEEPLRPLPTRGETGCRTRGDDDEGELGIDDQLRALGRVDVLRVVGRVRPLEPTALDGDGERAPLRTDGLVPGSIGARAPPLIVDGTRPGR